MPCSFFQDDDDEEDSYNDVPVGILCHEQENITPHMQSLHHDASSVGMHPHWESSWRETL
jgi:hypothetical protein